MIIIKNLIYLYLLIFILSCSTKNVISQRIVYVDIKSGCITECGLKELPFSNIQDAIKYLENSGGLTSNIFNPMDLVDQIILAPGIYSGIKNTNLKIIKPLQILSNEFGDLIVEDDLEFSYNRLQPVIQCDSISNGISIINTNQVKIFNIGIHNCVGVRGGGIYIENSSVELVKVFMFKNKAEIGGAIYNLNSRVNAIHCTFVENVAKEAGSVAYSDGSTISFLGNTVMPCYSYGSQPAGASLSNSIRLIDSIGAMDDPTLAKFYVDCNANSPFYTMANLGTTTSCPYNKYTQCAGNSNVINTFQYDYSQLSYHFVNLCNNNNICDNKEDCLICPGECSCQFTGWKLSVLYDLVNPLDIDYLDTMAHRSIASPDNMIKNYKFKTSEFYTNIYAKFHSYYSVEQDGKYKFKFYGENIGIIFLVNGITYLNAPLHLGGFNTSKEVSLSAGMPIKFGIVIYQFVPIKQADLSVYWKHENDQDFKLFVPFYSLNVCGDKILDSTEGGPYKIAKFECPSDAKSTQISCGDGICNEHATDCFVDCYKQFTDQCPEQAPSYPLDSIYEKKDFLGSVISNQYLFSLPGIQLLSHGVDIVTDKFVNSPLFHFGYCDNSSFSTIHDLYRGLVYTVPRGVYGVPVPKCSYQSQSDSYKTSSQMSAQLSRQTGLTADAEIGGGFWGYSFGAKVAFSQEESVNTARELEQSKSGEIFVTKVECETTRIHLDPKQLKLHKNFLFDLSQASTTETMKQLIKKYGSVYVKSANMGGKLLSITVVDHTIVSSQSSFDISKHTDLSFSMQVSSPILNVDGEASLGVDNKISNDQLKSFESQSTTSTIKTFGGGTGAYGPDTFGKNNFGEWAKQVDLSPIPLRKQYGFIYDLIPSIWMSNNNPAKSIKDLWFEAETLLMYQSLAGKDVALDQTIYYLNFPSAAINTEYKAVTLIGNHFSDPHTQQALSQIIPSIKNQQPFIAKLAELTFIGEQIPVGTLTGFEIIDLVNNRVYDFRPSPALQYQRNSYTVRMDKVRMFNCASETCSVVPKVLVIIRGKLGQLEFLFPNFATDKANSFTYNGKFIGELESITLQLKVKFETNLSNVNSYEIPYISVVQTCPNGADDKGDNGISKCTITSNMPVNSPVNILYSQMVKTPSYLSYDKPVTRTLTTKRLPPLPQIL